MADTLAQKGAGPLFVVATPIGNLQDITLRAIDTLNRVELIAAEDTRHTRRLLSAHGIQSTLISYHEHNERQRTSELIAKLQSGTSVALVTDAGTPGISDPGYRLITEALDHGIPVTPIPGASAVVTALSVSGLATDQFTFVGFPHRKKGKRLDQLAELATMTHTLVFYQSPRRLLPFLQELVSAMGDRPAVLAREQTKLHEEYIRAPLTEIIQTLKTREAIKGECTLLVDGAAPRTPTEPEIDAAIQAALDKGDRPISEIAKALAKQFGLTRKAVYDRVLELK
jgi:16S rRNA (cytidine1402-2'-O)-methyltransferase